MTINKTISFSGDGLPNSPQILADNIQNLSDISAQLAASHAGIKELQKLVNEKGINTVLNYMKHVKDNARNTVEDIIFVLAGISSFDTPSPGDDE